MRGTIVDGVCLLSSPFFRGAFSSFLPLPFSIPKVTAFDKLMLLKPLARFKRAGQCRNFFVLSVFMHAATT